MFENWKFRHPSKVFDFDALSFAGRIPFITSDVGLNAERVGNWSYLNAVERVNDCRSNVCFNAPVK